MYKMGCKHFKYLQDHARRHKTLKEGNDKDLDLAQKCHKIKLYDINLLSKSTDAKIEEEKKEPVEEIKEVPEIKHETYSFSGTFRDEVRRIDLIIVLPEADKSEERTIQTDFLSSIIKTGLQIELEPGLMSAHRNLTFIKIHAPYSVLEEYGEKLGAKKYFKDMHLEYIQPKHFCFKSKEKEWISLVRNSYVEPLRFSNSERSLLVYKILLNLRFGEHQNNFGLKRLLKWNIVSDVYALHDGPYFLTRKQKFSDVNARQILYYNWSGWTNIFNFQPINLIQEYFGSRVGFLFAFLQFYCFGLAVSSLAAILMTMFGVTDQTYEGVRSDTCNAQDSTMVCPRCYDFNACPFLGLKKYYCFGAKLVNVLDHVLVPAQCFFLVFWGIVLMILWRRKEKYWLWLWELNNIKDMINVRPEFSINYNKPVQSKRTGLWKYYNSGLSKVTRIAVMWTFYLICVCALSIYIYFVFFGFFKMVDYQYNEILLKSFMSPDNLPQDYEKYCRIATFSSMYLVIYTIYEKVWHIIAIYVTRFENHRSTESYDRSLAVKLFVVTTFTAYPLFVYYAWFKTRAFTFPGRRINPTYRFSKYDLIKDGYLRTCGPHPCIDEVFVSLTVCFLLKQVLPKMIYFFRHCLWPVRTDYNQGKTTNKKYPCWEREFRLKTITEDRITGYYNYLALQFGYITLFGAASPLLSVGALIINLIDIRVTAKDFLLASRRPLLFEKPGLDIWNTLISILAWSTILSNAILLAWNSRTGARRVYLKTHNNMTNFFYFTISPMVVSDYAEVPPAFSPGVADNYKKYTGFKPDTCYFIGNVVSKKKYSSLVKEGNWFFYAPSFSPLPEDFEMKMTNYYLLVIFHFLGLITALLAHFLIPPSPQDIEDSIETEQDIKDAFLVASDQ